MSEKKSDDHYVLLPKTLTPEELQSAIERASGAVGLYISHIGSYSRKKYPNSVHWHFKRDPKEPGLIDATFWDVKHLFWLMVRHREPAWVHELVPAFLDALRKEVASPMDGGLATH